jgi:hypothetical protein
VFVWTVCASYWRKQREILSKCELGLVCLAHFYVSCPGRVHTLTKTGCWLFLYLLLVLFFIVSFIVFICSERVTCKPNCTMFVLQCYGSNAFRYVTVFYRGRNSSVGIATCYGLDGPGIEFRCGTRLSAPVQTGPGAHPFAYTMGTGSLSEGEGVKRPRRGADHPPTHIWRRG